jgi:hypothetical protein
MTDETKQIVNKIEVHINMWEFWIAGWFFTIGYGGIDKFFDPASKVMSVWQQLVVSFVFWPMILGFHLKGG